MKNKKLNAHFVHSDFFIKCCMCGKFINEGYSLEPLSNEGWELLEKKFGDISNWFVGECCFGGYCGSRGAKIPDDWFELFIERRRHGKMQIKK